MIDVPVVPYFGLNGGCVDVVSNVDVIHTVSRTCNAGADLQLELVGWSRRIERVG